MGPLPLYSGGKASPVHPLAMLASAREKLGPLQELNGTGEHVAAAGQCS